MLDTGGVMNVDMEYAEYFEIIETETTGRYDVVPLFTDPFIFKELRRDLLDGISGEPTLICGIESIGFILGSAIAVDLGIGFVPLRKGGKLPYTDEDIIRREFIDYSNSAKTLEFRTDSVTDTDSVLLIDDWIETGAQMLAATELVEQAGATVHAIGVITADQNAQTAALCEEYDVFHLN